MNPFIILGSTAVVAIVILFGLAVWKFSYVLRRFPTCEKCPGCGAWMDGDRFRYRGVVVWTCRKCETVYETLTPEEGTRP